MIELLKAMQIIEFIKKVAGNWEVYHHTGGTEIDEETANPCTGGKVTIIRGGTIKAVYRDLDRTAKTHELRGSVSFGNFRYQEIIKWDGKDVEGDDFNVSSHFADEENRRLILDFKFVKDGERQWFRFKKEIEA